MTISSALPHVERVIAACLELGATQTTEQVASCWETTCAFGTPSHRYSGDTSKGDFRTTCDNDVTKHVLTWPAGQGPLYIDLVRAVLPETPALADADRAHFTDEQRVDFVEVWFHPELTPGNGRNHRGIVVAVMRKHTRLVGATQLPHFYTDREGQLHMGQFA